MKIPWWYTELGETERKMLLQAFDARALSMGSFTVEFERRFAEFVGARFAVLVPSGTAALTASLIALGVQPGDEVIVPDVGWIATANAASLIGAKVVLVDVGPTLPLINVREVEQVISAKTKVIIPVHLNGRACDLDSLKILCKNSEIAILEDACKALGSRHQGRSLGTFGAIGCYSLGMISLVTIGYGGVAVTDDEELYRKLTLIRAQGVASFHNESYAIRSTNFKVSDLFAALGLAQIDRVKDKITHLKKIYQLYMEGLKHNQFLTPLPVQLADGELPLLVEYRASASKDILKFLASHGIEGLPLHIPLHRAEYLKCSSTEFPNATKLTEQSFALPCGPSQPISNVERCIEVLNKYPG